MGIRLAFPMRIKFIQTTESDHPDCPFQAGQIISLAMSTKVRLWIERGIAVALDPVVSEPAREAAVLGRSEQATEARPRARGSR